MYDLRYMGLNLTELTSESVRWVVLGEKKTLSKKEPPARDEPSAKE